MASDPIEQSTDIEARATAFVFGELDREEAMEFMKQMAASTELQAIVASIRETVGTLQDEFSRSTPGVSEADRRRIEDAMKDVSPQPPPIVHDTSDGSRRWAISLAVAATLLLACGLTLPALNRAITASNETTKLREQIRQIEMENERLYAEKLAVEKRLSAMKVSPASEIAGETVADHPDRHSGTEALVEQPRVESEMQGDAPIALDTRTDSAAANDDALDRGGLLEAASDAATGKPVEIVADEPADESESLATMKVDPQAESAQRRRTPAGAAGAARKQGSDKVAGRGLSRGLRARTCQTASPMCRTPKPTMNRKSF